MPLTGSEPRGRNERRRNLDNAGVKPEFGDVTGIEGRNERPRNLDNASRDDSGRDVAGRADGSRDVAGRERARIGWRLWMLMIVVFLSMAMAMGQVTILGKQVFDMTGSELHLGLLGLAEFVPTALLAPVSGMVCDRCSRRLVFALGLIGEALASLGLFWYVASSPTSVAPILALVTGYAVARAFLNSASRALPADLAPEGEVERVMAVSAAARQAGFVFGPITFAFAFEAHIALPYLVAAAISAVGACLVALVPDSQAIRAAAAAGALTAVRNAFEGLRFIRGHRILLGAVSLDLFAVLLGGAVALLPAIAEERLGVGVRGLGLLRAATGIGALTVATVLAMRPVRRRVGTWLIAVVGVFGAATVVLGLTRSYVVAFSALLVLSAADSVSVYIRTTIVPLAPPEAMRGRVLAVEYVFIGASNELGAFRSGVAGQLLGVAGAVVAGGLGTLAVVALWWRLFPELRALDRFAEVRPP